MNIILGYIFTYIYLILVILLAYFLNKYTKLNQEKPRKIVHILVSFSWFIMVYFFKTTIHLIIPPLTFMVINYLSYTKNLIKPLERKTNNTPGHVYYAFSFAILAFLTYLHPDFLPYYGLGVLVMGIGDGMAPFISNVYPKTIGNTHKTYAASILIFIVSIVISYLISFHFNLNFSILKILIIALSSVILELIGQNGKDNLSLPVGVALISYLI